MENIHYEIMPPTVKQYLIAVEGCGVLSRNELEHIIIPQNTDQMDRVISFLDAFGYFDRVDVYDACFIVVNACLEDPVHPDGACVHHQ